MTRVVPDLVPRPHLAGKIQVFKRMNRGNVLVLKYRLRQALDTMFLRRYEIMIGFVGKRNRLSEQDQGGQEPTRQ